MAFSLFKIIKGLLISEENTLTPKEIEVIPGGTSGTKTSIVSSQTTHQTITLPDATDTLVGKATTDTLTNKAIDAEGTGNSITNLKDSNIKAGAAIDATKIADGSVSNAEFQQLDGATSNIQTQLNTNATNIASTASTAAANLAAHEADTTNIHGIADTSILATTTGSQTLTNKVISALTNTISNISNAEIKAGAAIALNKLAALTASRALVSDASGVITQSTVTSTELGYVSGVTSAIQSQLDSKAPAATAATLDDVQTLTNKSLASPLIDIVQLTEQSAAPSGSSSKLKLYGKTDHKLYYVDPTGVERQVGSGSGSGGINYISNPDAETDASGWSVFGDGLALSTGANNVSVTATLVRSTSSPLRGLASFLYTPGNQGNGIHYDFTIGTADKAKIMNISFDYQLSGTITEGDYQVWIYDRDTPNLMQPTSYKMVGTSGTNYTFNGQFQTSASSTNYRLIIWQAVSTSVTMKLDNVIVGPQSVSIVSLRNPVGTVIATGSTTPPQGYLYADGTAVSRTTYAKLFAAIGTTYGTGDGSTTFNLPNSKGVFLRGAGSQTINSKAFSATLGTSSKDGTAVNGLSDSGHTHGGITSFVGNVLAGGGSGPHYTGTSGTTSTGYASLTSTDAETKPANLVVAYHICYDDGSTIMSSDSSEGRVVAASYVTTSQSIPAAGVRTIINASTKDFDTFGAVTTGANWKFTAPVPGVYSVAYVSSHTGVALTTGAQLVAELYKNGTMYRILASTAQQSTQSVPHIITGQINLLLNAGDYIDIREAIGGTTGASIDNAAIYIEKLPGNQQIAASETVRARYTGATATITGSYSDVTWSTKDNDSHGMVSGATITIPAPGSYDFTGQVLVGGTAALNSVTNINITKNGTQVAQIQYSYGGSVSQATGVPFNFGSLVFNASDVVKIRIASNITSPIITGDGTQTYLQVKRIGN